MKSAVLIAADWPGDEVVLVIDDPEEINALRQHLGGVDTAKVAGRLVALMDRTGFRVLDRYVTEAVARSRIDSVDGIALRRLDSRLSSLGRRLAACRADDRSGDPLPGTALHNAMAGELAEAGR